ncbi:SH3 domain-containing YSC84-like protein 1 [Pelomyxa schiedti]|nr:SH3 domain-containing YSC84-like protein 1 [Pelomyxa schiedti]
MHKTAARGALLTDICHGAKLKHTVTVDKSGPVLETPKGPGTPSSNNPLGIPTNGVSGLKPTRKPGPPGPGPTASRPGPPPSAPPDNSDDPPPPPQLTGIAASIGAVKLKPSGTRPSPAVKASPTPASSAAKPTPSARSATATPKEDNSAELGDLKRQLEEANAAKSKAETALAELRVQVETLTNEVEKLRTENTSLKKKGDSVSSPPSTKPTPAPTKPTPAPVAAAPPKTTPSPSTHSSSHGSSSHSAPAPKAAPPPPPAKKALPQCEALFDYNSAEPGDLVFRKGAIISVLDSSKDWWQGELNGKQGSFPGNYVTLL